MTGRHVLRVGVTRLRGQAETAQGRFIVLLSQRFLRLADPVLHLTVFRRPSGRKRKHQQERKNQTDPFPQEPIHIFSPRTHYTG